MINEYNRARNCLLAYKGSEFSLIGKIRFGQNVRRLQPHHGLQHATRKCSVPFGSIKIPYTPIQTDIFVRLPRNSRSDQT